uniref:Integrin beta-like protein A-E N-terminal domain-containing protein n=1 Tax=Cryptomonas curvata TaxID=233186 RepID=A0A7S0M3A7_9CRYP|mmetsp:Transcript_22884/g.48001  ORF Transcript_22884/g.48001 Transcript_22884/m.48001 type:complete len:262 (+) Transcript_22884:89-874(+)
MNQIFLKVVNPVVFIVLNFCIHVNIAQPPAAGHYRAGSISWRKLEGNTVEFEVQSEWRKSYTGLLKGGIPAYGNMSINDLITVGGAEPPTLLFGDGSKIEIMSFYVTSFSVSEDWFRGVRRYNHTYKTPNRGWTTNPDGTIVQGAPWDATFAGCCRINATENDPDSPFSLQASLDLVQSSGSVFFQSPSRFTLHGTSGGDDRCLIPGQLFLQPQTVCFRIHAATAGCGAPLPPSSLSLSLSLGAALVHRPKPTGLETDRIR